MQKPTKIILLLLGLCTESLTAAITQYAFSEIPSNFHSNQLTVGSRALGELCYSRSVMPDGSVCSPSLLAQTPRNSLLFQMYLGNGYGALTTADTFVNKSISKEFLEGLFKEKNATSVDANAGLVFTSKYFSAYFQPYRVQYASEVHNPNFPVIAVHAANERRLGVAGGAPLSLVDPSLEKFSFGLGVKAFERKYLHGSFSLFQSLTEDPNQFLPIKSQSGVFIEPSLSYQEGPEYWNFLTTMSLTEAGPVWGKDPAYANQADLNLGVGVSPELGPGRFHFGIDFVRLLYANDLWDRIKVGSSYQLGAMEVMSGFNREYLSLGLQYQMSIVQAGISYEFHVHEYGGLRNGSKIATEVSVRL